jgi:selT/selW/selH-like putative selenoprotein
VIARELGLEAEIVPGSRGVFDVTVDGDVIFSKHRSHSFPEPEEIVTALRARMR